MDSNAHNYKIMYHARIIADVKIFFVHFWLRKSSQIKFFAVRTHCSRTIRLTFNQLKTKQSKWEKL